MVQFGLEDGLPQWYPKAHSWTPFLRRKKGRHIGQQEEVHKKKDKRKVSKSAMKFWKGEDGER